MMDGKTCPNHGYTHCVPPMCGGATLIKNGQQFNMKLIIKICHPIYKLPRHTNESTCMAPWTLFTLQPSWSNSTFKPFNRIWYDHKHSMRHVASAHGNDKEPNLWEKPRCLWLWHKWCIRRWHWGSGLLEDHSKWSRDQCASISNTSGSTTIMRNLVHHNHNTLQLDF
jgi:hypothetical protein